MAATERISLLFERGDVEKATAAFEPLWAQYRFDPGHLAPLLGRLGHQQEARDVAAEFIREPSTNPFNIFQVYFSLGEYDQALLWLRRTIDDGGVFVTFLRLPHQWSGLQEQPGYAEVLKYLDSRQRSH